MPNRSIMTLRPGSQKILKKGWALQKRKIRTLRPTCGRHRCFRALAPREHIGACSKFRLPLHPQSPAPPPPLESRFLLQFPQIPLLYSLYSSALSCRRSTRISEPEILRSILPSVAACCRSIVAWWRLTTSLPADADGNHQRRPASRLAGRHCQSSWHCARHLNK